MSGTSEDAAQGTVQAPEPEVSDGGPAQGAETQVQPQLYAGKYKSVDELEKGYRHTTSFATKVAEENKRLWEHTRKLEAEANARTQEQQQPAAGEDEIFNAIVEGRGKQAIARTLAEIEAEKARKSQQEVEAWQASRFAEWNDLMVLVPDISNYQNVIVQASQQYPTKPLAAIYIAVKQAEADQQAKAARSGGNMSEQDVANKVVNAMRQPVNSADANGRAPTPARAKLTKEEAAVAATFGISTDAYVKARDREK